MKKQIIVHIDPFNIQHNTINYAVSVARSLDLPLLLYSVYQYPVMPVTADAGTRPVIPRNLPPEWVSELKEKGEAYCETIRKEYPDTSFEYDLGFLADELVNKVKRMQEKASKHDPYFIILPKSSDHNWWNDVIGTTETTVAAKAPCPVLFVPEDAPFQGISRLMYLADTESFNNINYPGHQFLESFSQAFDASLVIAFLANNMEAQNKYRLGELMDKLKESLPLKAQEEFRFFPDFKPSEILKIAKLTHTDILAFPFRESNLFTRFFENEITRTLLLKADTPVLVF